MDESRPSKLSHYYDRSKNLELYWKAEETCYHLDSSERLSTKVGVKNSQEIIIKRKANVRNKIRILRCP